MSSTKNADLPNVEEILAGLLGRVSPDQRPLLVAIAERLAAGRYRHWARQLEGEGLEPQLLACADREEEIARRVEALHPEAEAIQRDIRAKHPDLEELNRSVFAGRPLWQQLTIQAQGERLGAATWRAMAQGEEDPGSRRELLACAELEEQNASVLETFLQGRG